MDCCGCGACALVCPKKCIKMDMDENGFLKSRICKPDQCIHCDLCKRICPMLIKPHNSIRSGKLFSGYALIDDIRVKSSSGGMATLLAQSAMQEGYKVCGVAYNYRIHRAEHNIANKFSQLDSFMGSKYLQSYSIDGFEAMINDLRTNIESKYIVFGTPCQISGLRMVVQHFKLSSRVIFIDIFCHGVPSSLLWTNYLNWLEKNKGIEKSKIQEIIFRDKSYSWHTYYMHVKAQNKEYIAKRDKDPFLKCFTMGITNSKSCFTCPYRTYSYADIRLGDFWGKRFKDREDGYSMIICLNGNATNILNKVSNGVMEQCDINEINAQQHSDFEIPLYYEKTFEMLRNNEPISKIIRFYESSFEILKKLVKRILKV